MQNSKFDIYYILNNESVTRELQVKFMSKDNNRKNGFIISDVTGYMDGMLMVCLNKSYNRNKTVSVSTAKNPKSEFSKILLQWDNFSIHLKNILYHGMIVTDELFKSSMTTKSYTEYESIERFRLLCEKYHWNFNRNTDTASVTDLYIDGFKVQMKYTNRFIITTGCNKVSLHKTGYKNNIKSRVSYDKGDNDYYIIELGSHLGEFLILSEKLLLDKGFISVNKQKALID